MDSEKSLIATRQSKFPFQGAAMLVLSLLLVGTVGGLIYISINGQVKCQTQQMAESVEIQADFTVTSGDQKKEEHITYNENSRVAYYSGADGSFEVDDFSKGLHIIRAPSNKVCYVIPVGANSNSHHGFENLLQTWNHGEVAVNGSIETTVEILPGEIEDTSFIPEGAHAECTNGYKWMVVTSSTPGGGNRKKRQAEGEGLECRYCFVFYVEDDGLYESCFEITGFSFCHILYKEGERPMWLQELIEE